MESRALLRGRSVLSEKYGARNGETGNLANINVNGVGRGRKKKKKRKRGENKFQTVWGGGRNEDVRVRYSETAVKTHGNVPPNDSVALYVTRPFSRFLPTLLLGGSV